MKKIKYGLVGLMLALSLTCIACQKPTSPPQDLGGQIGSSRDQEAYSQANKALALKLNNHETYYFKDQASLIETLSLVLKARLKGDTRFTLTLKGDYSPMSMIKSQTSLGPSTKQDLVMTIQADHQPVYSLRAKSFDPVNQEIITRVAIHSPLEVQVLDKGPLEFLSPQALAKEIMNMRTQDQTYRVQAGDTMSYIASKYQMSLAALYDLNPTYRSAPRVLQINDALLIKATTPKLSLMVVTDQVYTENLTRSIVYKEDLGLYQGLKKIEDQGADGLNLVYAKVWTLDDKEVDRQVLSREVYQKPRDQVILIGTKPLPKTGPAGFYIDPLESYRLTSKYGPRWGTSHRGIDMATPTGTPVYASDGGRVTMAGWYGSYGYMVEIDHGAGQRTRYAHNSRLTVQVGQRVGQGQVIALSGNTGNSTGPHLHFELIIKGYLVNPYDYFTQ